MRTDPVRTVVPTIVAAFIAIALCVGAVMGAMSFLDVSSSATEIARGAPWVAGLAVGLAGLLAWQARRGFEWRDSMSLDPLWTALGGRTGLLIGYLTLLLAWAWLCVQLSVDFWPELLANAFGNTGSMLDVDDRATKVAINLIAAAVLVLIQAAFLWSGGKLRIGPPVPKPYRLAVSAAIFALLMSILTTGLFVAILEGVDRFNLGDRFGGLTSQDAVIGVPLFASWTLWLPIAWFALRGVDRPTGLSRLAGLLLAGSWIEVAVALPIELIKRGRHEDCPCASGSWLALIVAAPILLWSLGPAVYLLYLRERALDARQPGHAQRILARRSTKVTSREQLT